MKLKATLGRAAFALAAIGSGGFQLVRQEFVRLVPPLPSWLGAPRYWALASAGVLVAAGVALLLNRGPRIAALALGALLALTLALHGPGVWANPSAGYVWTNPAKISALIGGCLLLGWAPVSGRPSGSAIHLCAGLLGLFLIVGGVQHGVYVDFVTTLVPEWLPARQGWAWFTGGALVAGGLGLLLPQTRRWAGAASAAMIFSWVFLLHIPRALAHPADAGEVAAIFEALALSAVCWLVAAGTPPAGSGAGRR